MRSISCVILLTMRSIFVAFFGLLGGVASAGPSHGAKRVTIDYTYSSFHHDERHYTVEWKTTGYVAGKRAIDGKVIDGLYDALTGLHDSADEQRCISHTDDYPEFTVTIEGDDPLVVSSKSNCHGYVPWNVTRKGKRFAQYNGQAGRAVRALLFAIDPDHWKRPPDSPEATMDMGTEYVPIAEYRPGDTTTPAGSCARELEHDARSRELFGEAVTVGELVLVCDLSASPECTATIAASKLRWDGVEAQLELPCTGGHVDFAAGTARIAELHRLLDSKPVRALVKLSGRTPRLFFAGTWRILASDGDLPDLDYEPGTAAIEARAASEHGPGGVAFWKALGLDAAKLTKVQDGFSVTSATLDFDGRVK